MKLRIWARILMVGVLMALLSLTATAQEPAESGVLHDSRNDLYRTPGGAVVFGTKVTLRLRTLQGEADGVNVRIYSTFNQTQSIVALESVAVTPEGYELWETTLDVGTDTTVIYYRFILRKRAKVWYYEDDTMTGGEYNIAHKGGVGAAMDVSIDASYQIGVYDPAFYTPAWMRNAIVYQIFPDRFRNGDKSNDPASGSETFYGELDLIFHDTWNEAPVDGRRVQTDTGLGYFNSDFFGGDFAGITEKLDYLQSLGVTAIYLNPIFEARSNHRYDTVDYKAPDPFLGTMDDFRTMIVEGEGRGITFILDGVFNHMSSDSVLFDRYGRFEGDLGACESVDSDYRTWFVFSPPTGAEPAACVDDGADNTFYESWFGFDSIPKIDNTKFSPRAYFFKGADSVARLWGAEGIGGWRLDVGGDIDNGRDADNTYWEGFRKVVRAVNPEAVIIGEEWNDSTEWLLGDEWDSVMNYRYRRAIIGLVNGRDFADNDGKIIGLTPADFESAIRGVEEDYPPMAYHAMMNLLGSHDTVRSLNALGDDVESLKLAASVLFTLPGAPTIYYGDEIAIDAPNIDTQDDPYNRAPYPWADESGDTYPAPNEDVLAHYQALGALRHANSALREGEMITLDATDDVLTFIRLDAAAGNAVLVAVNVSDSDVSYTFPVELAGGVLPTGLTLEPALGASVVVSTDSETTVTLAPRSTSVWTTVADPALFQAAPISPAVTTSAESGAVTVTWQPIEGAASYYVYRSPVSVGGFERLIANPITDTSYVDSLISNGYVYHYAVAPANVAGVAGELVYADAPAVPFYPIDSVAFVDDPSTTLELQVGLAVDVTASLSIAGITGSGEPVQGVRAQAALFLTDVPSTWTPMSYSGAADGADVYTATLTPVRAGEYAVMARFSTDAGQTWSDVLLSDNTSPLVVVNPGSDTTSPEALAAVNVIGAGVSGVSLAWESSSDADAALYRIYRTDQTGAIVLLGELAADAVTYDDVAVSQGNKYTYAVTVVDNGLNESARVDSREVDVTRATFKVRLIVDVPEKTPDDAVVYVAGDFKSGDAYPTWDPGAPNMLLENLGNDQFAITLEFQEGISIDYKFVRGTWDAVEKGTDCEEISNRVVTVGLDSLGTPTADGVYEFTHQVAKWRDLDSCG